MGIIPATFLFVAYVSTNCIAVYPPTYLTISQIHYLHVWTSFSLLKYVQQVWLSCTCRHFLYSITWKTLNEPKLHKRWSTVKPWYSSTYTWCPWNSLIRNSLIYSTLIYYDLQYTGTVCCEQTVVLKFDSTSLIFYVLQS